MDKVPVMSVNASPWQGIAVPHRREPQAASGRGPRSRLRVVSADSHWTLAEDVFWTGFPAHLKHKAPRVWFDDNGVPLLGDAQHNPLIPAPFREVLALSEGRPGAWQVPARMRDLELEGIRTDIAFPNAVLALLVHPDLEVRELIYSVYNEHIADKQGEAPGRFYGVGLLQFW